jgi:hypothetical protein
MDTVSDDEFISLLETIGPTQTASRLGRSTRSVYERRRRLEAELGRPIKVFDTRNLISAALRGHSPPHGWNQSVPETHVARGVSTLYDAQTGAAKLQWLKADLDHEARERAVQAALDAMRDKVPKAAPVVRKRANLDAELANLYVITDFHLGMYSWGEETGEAWDLVIAEKLLVDWFGNAIALSPNAEQGILCQLGDFLHFDSLEAVTPTSRHQLDADTRYQKIVRVAIRVLRQIIAMLLAKHERLHVIMADANHDPAGSAWLREAFAAFYAEEPRITVDTSPDTYYAFEWGETSLFFHHGHRRKPESVSDVFAAKFRSIWGKTAHSYAHLGHLHHRKVLEGNLMMVEQHRTLAAKDSYASSHGFISGRDASCITYHKKYGEVGRVTVSARMASDE